MQQIKLSKTNQLLAIQALANLCNMCNKRNNVNTYNHSKNIQKLALFRPSTNAFWAFPGLGAHALQQLRCGQEDWTIECDASRFRTSLERNSKLDTSGFVMFLSIFRMACIKMYKYKNNLSRLTKLNCGVEKLWFHMISPIIQPSWGHPMFINVQ